MVKIVADTLSSIPVEEAERLGIAYLPQIIIFGDESYKDDHEIDTDTFLNKLRSSPILPKTAAPPPALYTPIFSKYLAEGHSIIVLCPSAILSGTFRGASVAAQDFPGADIRVIDTNTIAGGLGSLVLMANEWANQGMSADEITHLIGEWANRHHTYFLVDTLEYLHKGGRIGGAQALVGSLLQVKPILTLREGRIEAFESQRTKKRAFNRLIEIIRQECPEGPDSHICVMQGDAAEDAQCLVDQLRGALGVTDIPIYKVPPAIVVHGGPGVLAVGYFTRS